MSSFFPSRADRRMSRRAFLERAGAAGIGTALSFWLLRAEQRAEGKAPPKRFMLMHRPNGTIPSMWLNAGMPGPILAPFEGLPMCVLSNVHMVTEGATTGHEAGMVTWATGTALGPTRPGYSDDWINTSRSLDLLLTDGSATLSDVPLANLNLAAHDRQDSVRELSDATLTYRGPDDPIFPDTRPSRIFARVFSGVLPSGDTPENRALIARIRANKHSVLDLVRDDLAALERVAPSHERAKIEAHAEAIRDLERRLDTPLSETCSQPPLPVDGPMDTDDFVEVGRNGAVQLELVRAAFACDLTRQVTFMWSVGLSGLQFEGLFPGMERISYHHFSHADAASPYVQARLGAVDTWFSEGTATFLRALAATESVDGGSLLDDTLVLYINEVAEGASHVLTPMPVALFGGSRTCLTSEPVVDAGGQTTNDLWLTIARQLGVAMPSLGNADQWSGPIPGIFVEGA